MFKKLLVPLDGSKLSECALEHVKEIASGCQASEVVLLTVLDINLPPVSTWGLPQAEALVGHEQAKKRQNIVGPALEYLTRQGEQLKAAGISVKIEMLEEGGNQRTPDLIINYARNNNIDLIVMSSHGHSGISRWAFGNVADKVVRGSQVPVLTVIPAGCRI
jgi:nucleotide-binding universal stress UspA family protein